VKAGGDLTRARLKGAVAPEEILSLCDSNEKGFLDCDPKEGFSVRNFAIQTAKMAQVSDIVIYGEDSTDQRIIKSVAERTSSVQKKWKKHLEASGQCPETYHTYVLTDSFEEIERNHPELVAVNSRGRTTGHTMDFLQWEHVEMCAMSKSSEFSKGVYQGPSPGANLVQACQQDEGFHVLIETNDRAQMPDEDFLMSKLNEMGQTPIHLTFPSSGSILPPSRSQSEVDSLLAMCRFIYAVTHPKSIATSGEDQDSDRDQDQIADSDGDIQMQDLSSSPSSSSSCSASIKPRTVLIHCADGYTESTLLAIAYFMFAEGVPVHTAWLRMHCDKGRNFFAYPSDVALLTSIQPRLLAESPANPANIRPAPAWLSKLDGSLPSRILPYMYLGNLTHANNPELLRQMGIKRILSIGEPVSWVKSEHEKWDRENLMMVDRVQDNGIDPLTGEFERCLEFIGKRNT
jgi:dual specificity MAP kinase phosphatase